MLSYIYILIYYPLLSLCIIHFPGKCQQHIIPLFLAIPRLIFDLSASEVSWRRKFLAPPDMEEIQLHEMEFPWFPMGIWGFPMVNYG